MRLTFVFATLGVMAAASPASAQTYPYCYEQELSGSLECSYLNMAQCLASASGRAGRCVQNPSWAPSAPVSSKRRTR